MLFVQIFAAVALVVLLRAAWEWRLVQRELREVQRQHLTVWGCSIEFDPRPGRLVDWQRKGWLR